MLSTTVCMQHKCSTILNVISGLLSSPCVDEQMELVLGLFTSKIPSIRVFYISCNFLVFL